MTADTLEQIDLSIIELPDEPELCDAPPSVHGPVLASWKLIVSCGCISHICHECRYSVEMFEAMTRIKGAVPGCRFCGASGVTLRIDPL